jgi:hypothetical protein
VTSPKIGCPAEAIFVPHSELAMGIETWVAVCGETTYECSATVSTDAEVHVREHRSGRVHAWVSGSGVVDFENLVCTKK